MARPNLVAVSLAITTFIIGLEAAPTFNHHSHSHGHNAAFTQLLHRHQHNVHHSETKEPGLQEPSAAASSATGKATEDIELPTAALPLLHIGPKIESSFETRYADDTGV